MFALEANPPFASRTDPTLVLLGYGSYSFSCVVLFFWIAIAFHTIT